MLHSCTPRLVDGGVRRLGWPFRPPNSDSRYPRIRIGLLRTAWSRTRGTKKPRALVSSVSGMTSIKLFACIIIIVTRYIGLNFGTYSRDLGHQSLPFLPHHTYGPSFFHHHRETPPLLRVFRPSSPARPDLQRIASRRRRISVRCSCPGGGLRRTSGLINDVGGRTTTTSGARRLLTKDAASILDSTTATRRSSRRIHRHPCELAPPPPPRSEEHYCAKINRWCDLAWYIRCGAVAFLLSPLTNQLLLAAWRGVAWRSPSIISIPATDRARPLPRTPGARRHHLHAWAYVGGGIVRNDQLTMYGTIVGRLPPCFVHRPDGGGLFSGPRARRGRRPPTPGELAGPPPKVQYAICNCCVGIISGFRCPPPDSIHSGRECLSSALLPRRRGVGRSHPPHAACCAAYSRKMGGDGLRWLYERWMTRPVFLDPDREGEHDHHGAFSRSPSDDRFATNSPDRKRRRPFPPLLCSSPPPLLRPTAIRQEGPGALFDRGRRGPVLRP